MHLSGQALPAHDSLQAQPRQMHVMLPLFFNAVPQVGEEGFYSTTQ